MSLRHARTPAAVLLAIGITAAGALLPSGPGPTLPAANAVSKGMFKVICPLSHSAMDDPIIYPRQPGKAHLHNFFGNTSTDAYSSLASLRSSGTTCENRGDTAAYWAPALYQGGKLVRPKQAQVYYRASNADRTKIRPFPPGLKMVGGTRRRPGLSRSASWPGTAAR